MDIVRLPFDNFLQALDRRNLPSFEHAAAFLNYTSGMNVGDPETPRKAIVNHCLNLGVTPRSLDDTGLPGELVCIWCSNDAYLLAEEADECLLVYYALAAVAELYELPVPDVKMELVPEASYNAALRRQKSGVVTDDDDDDPQPLRPLVPIGSIPAFANDN